MLRAGRVARAAGAAVADPGLRTAIQAARNRANSGLIAGRGSIRNLARSLALKWQRRADAGPARLLFVH